MKKYLELLNNTFALNSIMSIFDNDAHRIVSKRGEAILRDKDKIKAIDWIIKFAKQKEQGQSSPIDNDSQQREAMVCPVCEKQKELVNNLYCQDCNNGMSDGLGIRLI